MNTHVKKEQHWSKFVQGFEKRNNYMVDKSSMKIFLHEVAKQKNLKNTLELGCRNGTYSKVLTKNATQLLATDFSNEMVSFAAHALKKMPNTVVEKASCFDLPYNDNHFNILFMANLLHIINQPQKALPECNRVLKQEKILLLLDIGVEGIIFFNKVPLFYRYKKTYGKQPANRQTLTVNKIQNLLVINGFKIEQASLIGTHIKPAYVIAIKNNS